MKISILFYLALLFIVSCKENTTEPVSSKEKILKTNEVVFFSSDRDGKATNIFMMTPEGEIIKQITKYNYGEYAATAISPDKNQLLFYQATPGLDIDVGMDIYIYKIKEDSLIGPITNGHPGNFSPDGQKFVFHRHTFTLEGGYESVYLYDLTNNTEKKITDDGKTSFHAQISPDGKYICYESSSLQTEPLYWQLHIMGINGNFVTDLTQAINSYWAGNGVFTPDGKFVLFHYSDWDGGYDICKVDINTKQISHLVKPNIAYLNYWNPSVCIASNKVYFYSSRYIVTAQNYITQICSCNMDGSNFRIVLTKLFPNDE